MAQIPFREQMLRAREDALIAAVNRLLAEKGYEAMTIDAVATDVGIAKASLYKHFASKEELAAAAMTQVLARALAECDQVAAAPGLDDLQRLQAMARWALQQQLAGRMPSLPAQNSSLRAALMAHPPYRDRLLELGDRLGGWIEAAQAAGQIDPLLPVHLVLYTLFARSCDPVAMELKASGEHSDAQIVDWLLRTCFTGLRSPAG
jgi:AcrR family transcriptional regulator